VRKSGFVFCSTYEYKKLETLQNDDLTLLIGVGLITSPDRNDFWTVNVELRNKNLIPYRKIKESESMKLYNKNQKNLLKNECSGQQ